MTLNYLERPAAGDPAGLLILHHGRGARRAHELLDSAGLTVEYHESDAARHIDPAHIPAAGRWLAAANDPSRSMATPVAQPN